MPQPGSRRRPAATPVPYRRLIIPLLLFFVEALATSVVLPLTPFLVREHVRHDYLVGYYSGCMNAAFVAGLKDSKEEWKKARSTEPRPDPSGGKHNSQATVKGGFCRAFNKKNGCANGKNCRNGKHACSVCGSTQHGASVHSTGGGGGTPQKRGRGESSDDKISDEGGKGEAEGYNPRQSTEKDRQDRIGNLLSTTRENGKRRGN